MNWTRWQLEEYQRRHMKLPEPPSLSSSEAKESELHNEIIAFCNSQWPRWPYIHCRMDKRSTVAVGCQDFTIFRPDGKVLCIEVKGKGKKRTPEQIAWAFQMQKVGYTVHCIHSWAEFLELV